MNNYPFWLASVCIALLTACSNTQVVANEDSPFFSVPLGSTFKLNHEITIKPDQTSVYLQNGRIEPVGNIDIFRAHCKFELFTISDQARVVNPDTFVVRKIVDRREDVSRPLPLYAGLSLAVDGGPMHETYSTVMFLESKVQPDVFRMDCRQWDWVNTGVFVSISQMREALGDHFTLTLAQ